MTRNQLRRLIREAVQARLDELYPGSRLGSYLKQGVAKLWEADALVQRAMSEVETDKEHGALSQLHKAIEKLAFHMDGQMTNLERQSGGVSQKPKSLPPKPKAQ